jgi:hypothetical protein
VQIVDHGRGPQLSNSRITVLDVFYYLHRGHGFDVVHDVMPSLSRAEFDLIVDYVNEHREELIERDNKAEEFVRKGIEAQRARGGIFAESDENQTTGQRVAQLREKMKRKMAEKNGERHAG